MLLFLCYVCPPLAVLLMGRPFSAVGNFVCTMFFWVPGIKHALVCYADYKGTKSVKQITGAINNPAWARAAQTGGNRRRSSREAEEAVVYDNPHVGKGGTYFRPKNN
jgi:uncharacterized membrane protein YqaE (UPF0057 family)